MPYRLLTIPLILAWLLLIFSMPTAGATTLTVTNTNDSGAGSLRGTIANAGAGDTITFAAGITTINLTSGQLSLDKNLTIDGGSGVTVARQTGSSNFRIFNISAGNTVILNNLTISNGNTPDNGGGIANAGTLTVTNSTFSGNNAAAGGGGIYHTIGTLTVSNSTFSGNSADDYGGGILSISTLRVSNSTFSGNNAIAGYGGGIFSHSNSALTVTNSTFSGNSAATGGGIFSNCDSTLHLSNTILANSPSGGDCASSGGTITASGVNLVEDGTCTIPDALTADPLLGPLANNGGPTQTMALLPGSPALDVADDAICAAEPVNGLDQRGVSRPQGTHCDIGAFEAAAALLHLAFGQQPTTTVAGAVISPAVTVRIVDRFGNPTTSTANVTLALGTNPGGSTLSGTTTVAAVNGVATFSNLSINHAGTGYTLTAASDSLTGATSSAFNVTAAALLHLTFGQQPTTTVARAAISPAVTVRIVDRFGNPTTSTANVTLALGTNPGGSTLSGTTTVAAANGVATFSNLSINRAGTGYTLKAASGSLTGATSSAFNVTAAAHHLAFSQQPTTTVAGAAISPAVTVRIVDRFGNPTTSTANVTLALGTNPGGSTLSGTTTVAAVNGVATFSNLSINRAGTGYTLKVASGSLTGATSSAFNVTAAAHNLAFSQQPTTTIPTLSEWALLALAGLLGGLLWQARRRFD